MGVTFNIAQLMWNAKQTGASFEKVCTLGRLSLYLHPAEIAFFRKVCTSLSSEKANLLWQNYKFRGTYADNFFIECFGTKSISAIDYSSYQGADIVHDLNMPISGDFDSRFDVVIDGGTLEHIFNFPIAMANMMKMVKVGGRVFMTSPANNLCGHGLYQFSPELMFRIFSPENGFEVIHLQLMEARFPSTEITRNRKVYEVSDPKELKTRVGFINQHPVMMMVEARKLVSVPLFTKSPLQSDYVTTWAGHTTANITVSSFKSILKILIKLIFPKIPDLVKNRLIGYQKLKRWSLSNRDFFHRL